MKIVVINGKAGVGKDEIVNICQMLLPRGAVRNISAIDYVKEVATSFGWNGTKTPQNRKYLSDLKQMMIEWGDIPFKKMVAEVEDFKKFLRKRGSWLMDNSVIFIHCREPEEIQKLKNHFGDEMQTLLVRRASAEEIEQINDSDNNVLNYNYDYTLENDGTLWDLVEETSFYLKEILKLNIE